MNSHFFTSLILFGYLLSWRSCNRYTLLSSSLINPLRVRNCILGLESGLPLESIFWMKENRCIIFLTIIQIWVLFIIIWVWDTTLRFIFQWRKASYSDSLGRSWLPRRPQFIGSLSPLPVNELFLDDDDTPASAVILALVWKFAGLALKISLSSWPFFLCLLRLFLSWPTHKLRSLIYELESRLRWRRLRLALLCA